VTGAISPSYGDTSYGESYGDSALNYPLRVLTLILYVAQVHKVVKRQISPIARPLRTLRVEPIALP
jgi:hypothetical protein